MKKIAVVGLGYVGLPLAAEFGRIRPTIGFDIDAKRVADLKNAYDVTREVDASAIKQARHLVVTHELDLLRECEIFIVTVPTPVDSSNAPDLAPLLSACGAIGTVIKPGSLVIFESTVFPGCTEEVCVPELERVSALSCNVQFSVGYSPERINPGDKINTLRNIVKITSGSNVAAAQEIDELYSSIIDAGTFRAASIKVAEAAKVIENSQRDLNIAFVNELSHIFNRMDIDTLDVLEAAGTKWNFLPFRPGLVGGHCIGVDPYYLTYKAERVGYHPQIILAGRRINDMMAVEAAKHIVKLMVKCSTTMSEAKVAVLGATFKDNCPDVRNSKVFDLVNELIDWGVEVALIDPWANKDVVEAEYGLPLIELTEDLKVDAIVVAVAHKQFAELSPKFLKSLCKGDRPVFADLKAIYSKSELEECGFIVFRL